MQVSAVMDEHGKYKVHKGRGRGRPRKDPLSRKAREKRRAPSLFVLKARASPRDALPQ